MRRLFECQWAVLNRGHEASGWFFEFENEFYPDTDDTSMVLMALARCLPSKQEDRLSADFLLADWSPQKMGRRLVVV